ncbi:MAG: glycosyltransferase [Thermoleophilia bacterium]|nr:glycosyltransferase [Thermoleophilia bacterium]
MGPGALTLVDIIVGVFFSVFAIGYSTLLLNAARAAFADMARARRRAWGAAELAASPHQPSVTVVVPAHDEAASIVASVRSLLAQGWRRLEVLVVANGCTDDTLGQLHRAFDLQATAELLERPPGARSRVITTWRSSADPRLRVIETSAGGKADATNCALERAGGEYALLVDADSLLEPTAVAQAVLPFIEGGEQVVAVSAAIRVLNGSHVDEAGRVTPGLTRSPLALLQCLEYARAFHIGRAGWAALGALPVVSGAFGMFRTDVLRACGGLDVDTVGEDLEIVLRLHATVRRDGRRPEIVFLGEALCWTEVPEDVASLRAQRIRWHRGLVEAVNRHGGMLFSPRHGAVGMVSLPFLGLFELLAPLVELLGLAALAFAASTGAIAWTVVAALAGFAVCFGLALGMAALLLEQIRGRGLVTRPRDVAVLLLVAIVEQFGHRQRTAWWRLRGLAAGLRGGTSGTTPAWGEMHHRGARSVTAP